MSPLLQAIGFDTYWFVTNFLLISIFVLTAIATFGITRDWVTKASVLTNSQRFQASYILLMVYILILAWFFKTFDQNLTMIALTTVLFTLAIYIFLFGFVDRNTQYSLATGLILLVLGLVIIFYGFHYVYPTNTELENDITLYQFMTDLYANGGAELISIAITVVILEQLSEKQRTHNQREALRIQKNSLNYARAVEAIQLLNENCWLEQVLKEDPLLPDGTTWTPNFTNMRKFTHPREWQKEQNEVSSSNPKANKFYWEL